MRRTFIYKDTPYKYCMSGKLMPLMQSSNRGGGGCRGWANVITWEVVRSTLFTVVYPGSYMCAYKQILLLVTHALIRFNLNFLTALRP